MPHKVVRTFKAAVVATLVSALLAAACLLAPLAVPLAWREYPAQMSNAGTEVYVIEGGPPAFLRYVFEFDPIGTVLHRATRITVQIQEPPLPSENKALQDRAEAIARIRTQFIKACYDNGSSDLAGMFNQTLAAPGQTLVVEHPERRAAWLVMWAARVGTYATIAVLSLSLLAVLWALPRWLSVRKLVRYGRCVHCGYSLAGIPGDRCPECGKTQDSA